MASNVFEHAEEQYFLLRGQLETGRLSHAQFEEALQKLMVQDGAGRYWILGVQSGKWFVNEGPNWVQATPAPGTSGQFVSSTSVTPPTGQPVSISSPGPESVSSSSLPASPRMGASAPSPSMVPTAAGQFPKPSLIQSRSNMPLLLGGGGLLVLLLLCGGGLFFANSLGVLKIGLGATNTPTAAIFPGLTVPPFLTVPSNTTPLSVPSIAPTVPGATAIVSEATPTSPFISLATLAPLPTAPIATATPTLRPTGTVTRLATVAPTRTPTKPPATSVPATSIPTASLPPGVYVTDLKTDPSSVHDGQYPTFIITFANSMGKTVYYRVFVKLYEPDKRQSFGETSKLDVTLNPGTNVFPSANNWKAVGTSPCRTFIARVFYESPDKTIVEFPKPGGDSYWYNFNVCQ